MVDIGDLEIATFRNLATFRLGIRNPKIWNSQKGGYSSSILLSDMNQTAVMHPRFSVKSSFKGNEIDASDGRYATKAGKQKLKAPRSVTCNATTVNTAAVTPQKPTPVAASTVAPKAQPARVQVPAKKVQTPVHAVKTVQIPQKQPAKVQAQPTTRKVQVPQQQKIVAQPARAVQAAPKAVPAAQQPKQQVQAPRAQAKAAQAQSIRIKAQAAPQPKIEVQAPQCGARTVQVPQKTKVVAQPQIQQTPVSRPRHQAAPVVPQTRISIKPAQQPTVQDRNYWKGGQVVQGIAQANDPNARQKEAARQIEIQKHARRGVRQEAPEQIRHEAMTINVPASALDQDEFILELPEGVNMDNVTINVEAALDEVEEVEESAIPVPVNGRHREAFKVAPPAQKDTRDFAAIEKERAAEERAHYRSKNIVAAAAPLPAKSHRFTAKNN